MRTTGDAMTRGLLLATLAACSQVFGLEQGVPRDDEQPLPDVDVDTVDDRIDNCPGIANPDQHDEDGDARGDLCDNCPVVPNPTNSDEGDRDGVGDACDPNPIDGDTCLVLAETFRDPASYAANWRAVSYETAPSVTVETDGVTLAPAPGSGGIAIVERSIAGVYDVQVAAHATLNTTSGRLDATTGVETLDARWYCGVARGGPTGNLYRAHVGCAGMTTCNTQTSELSSAALRDNVLARMGTTASDGSPALHCTIRHGIALGDQIVGSPAFSATGGSGAFVYNNPARIDAIAIYTRATPCPAPVVR